MREREQTVRALLDQERHGDGRDQRVVPLSTPQAEQMATFYFVLRNSFRYLTTAPTQERRGAPVGEMCDSTINRGNTRQEVVRKR